jgi:hypothetical protein
LYVALQGAFRAVAAETGETVKEVVAALRQRLLDRKGEVSECIQLLRKMGEPVESLQEDYLECRQLPSSQLPFSVAPTSLP